MSGQIEANLEQVEEIVVAPQFFEVKLDQFDGPIDLLLHLVKQRELPIEKLSLAEVSAQYLECIEQMQYLDLEIAGEYLVIAATLLSIKSSVLLNEPVQLIENESGDLINPHDELLRRLREAAIFKETAQRLGEFAQLGIDVFSRQASSSDLDTTELDPTVALAQHEAALLSRAFLKVLKRAKQLGPQMFFSIEHISVVERMVEVVNQLKSHDGVRSFDELVPDYSSRTSIIGTFLALLELCKRLVVRVSQQGEIGAIQVMLAANVESISSENQFDSEFDQSVENENQRGSVNG